MLEFGGGLDSRPPPIFSKVRARSPRTSLGLLAVAAVLAVGAAAYFLGGHAPPPKYVTATVTRGPIVREVVATGTVNPVTTVQVGSYVSGPIKAIYADFNSPVKAGQLIAKIDPRPFQVKVDQADAGLATAKAQLERDEADLEYKRLTYQRDIPLQRSNVISKDMLDSAQSAYQQAVAQTTLDRANIKQAQAALQEARVNLNYTDIVSPVDGTIVSRNVDVGQTVAASFQTPTLFLIAKDLTRMQVDSNVSESDIGNVRTGQAASFTVDAFPGRTFRGVVGQVRQAPITVQNVVTYDVVVSVGNPEYLLKPGMTAFVTIVTARHDDVLRVPVQALHFVPQGSSAARPPGPLPRTGEPGAHGHHQARVWVLDGEQLRAVSIVPGLSDGSNVEVREGKLKPGDNVVINEVRTAGAVGRRSPFGMRRF